MKSTITRICFGMAAISFIVGVFFAGTSFRGSNLSEIEIVEGIIAHGTELSSKVKNVCVSENPTEVMLALVLDKVTSLPGKGMMYGLSGIFLSIQLLIVGQLFAIALILSKKGS